MTTFFGHIGKTVQRALPYGAQLDPIGRKAIEGSLPPGPPPPPGPPNPNDAANAAQRQTDALRLRRGMLANIFAGATSTQPVSGKTQLGSG